MKIVDLEGQIDDLNKKVKNEKKGKSGKKNKLNVNTNGGKLSRQKPQKTSSSSSDDKKLTARTKAVVKRIQKLSSDQKNIDKNIAKYEQEFEEFEKDAPADYDKCSLMLQSFGETLDVIESELNKEIRKREDIQNEY